ncbi:hypothetical protein OAQ99_03280 [Candidatus Kapabacteria bacterium]|nr:hypothetical protein [Candidatus Kapabacteria bacterium]
MYEFLLNTHSLLRWFVLIPLVILVLRSWQGWITNSKFSSFDRIIKSSTVGFIHLQFIIGLALYFLSPLIQEFIGNLLELVKVKEVRFFGMEHSITMLLAVVFATIGSSKSKKKINDKDSFRVQALWFTIVLILIFMMIPWDFINFTPNR